MESLCPPVRELRPGERPSDWAKDTFFEADCEGVEATAPAEESTTAPARVDGSVAEPPPLTELLLYQMQFTATDEHVQLVERAKALLARQSPGKSLGDLHLQAMRLLVDTLEKRRFGAKAKPHQESTARGEAAGAARNPREETRDGVEVPGQTKSPLRPGRYIPAALRRAVFERDGGRCAYVAERGERCHETHGLEIHHLKAFEKGGSHVLENLALRCQSHNTLAAEQDFGREHIARKSDGCGHESRRRQGKAR